MPEISIPKQLSGREALDSMLAEVRKKLAMNGRFQPHMAYSGYKAEVTIKFYPAASFIPPVEQAVEVEGGFIGFEGVVLSETATVDETVEIPVRPPNQVREDADMATPVLAPNAQGNLEERWVKKQKAPKNTVKGGETKGKSSNVKPGPEVTMVPTAVAAGAAEAARAGIQQKQ